MEGLSSCIASLIGCLVQLKQYKKSVRGLVVDPVMIATSGHALAESSVAGALQKHLLPLATLVTPNIPEASALLGKETKGGVAGAGC
jgi:hydroxymethylpyrimidine/phosphomethylpyrimidine kinase